ncbi:MAG: nitrilase-related carbon-nitrogen hydrolase [Lentisphaeria bacterium]|jgi:nitrilase|nr:nitrilase-related carbon-nitrogen hydrolase [Lentisphaeria bacterium]
MISLPQNPLALALVQMASQPDPRTNLATVRRVLGDHTAPEDLAVFPECVLCLGRGQTVRATAQPMAATAAELGALCRETARAALFGGVAVRDGDRLFNRALLVAADGRLLAQYDKMHLFRLDPDTPSGIDESRTYAAGDKPVTVDYCGWRLGLSICYDLRFPELFRAWGPVDLAVCTAAFTAGTGLAHWEVLLRARAIENQCYMAAAAQCGSNAETGVEHYGNSLLADPWGQIRAQAGDGEGVLRVTLEPERIREVRQRLPALDHRLPL